jgi:hypothetical protein
MKKELLLLKVSKLFKFNSPKAQIKMAFSFLRYKNPICVDPNGF